MGRYGGTIQPLQVATVVPDPDQAFVNALRTASPVNLAYTAATANRWCGQGMGLLPDHFNPSNLVTDPGTILLCHPCVGFSFVTSGGPWGPIRT